MFHTQALKNPDILQQWNLVTGCGQWMLIEDMWDNKGNIIQASINSRHPIMLIFVITNRILIRNVNTKPIYKILQIHNGNIMFFHTKDVNQAVNVVEIKGKFRRSA